MTLGVLGVFPTSLFFRTKDCAVQSLVYLMGSYGLFAGKPDVVLSVCSPNTHNIEAGGSKILGLPWLQRVRGLPGYMRPYLKTATTTNAHKCKPTYTHTHTHFNAVDKK